MNENPGDRRQRPVQPSQPQPPPPVQAQRVPPHAAARAPEHQTERGPERPRVRTRTPQRTIQNNPHDIPLDEIPEGSSYEWKRYSVVGEGQPFYIQEMRKQGWEPVDPRRHPNWVPPGYREPHIVRDGLILMERPIELTNEARAEQKQLARQQMREAEQRLGMTPRDTMTRQYPGVEPRVTKEYVRAVVEE